MKVENQGNYGLNRAETRGTQKASRNAKTGDAAAAGDAAASGDVSSDISPRAREFSKAKEVAASAPEVREAKIAELKRRIANKEYNVKPDDVADRMIQDHLQTHGLG